MNEMKVLRRELECLNAGTGRRYPAQVKDRMFRLATDALAAGRGIQSVSTEIGVPLGTLRRFMRGGNASGLHRAGGFVPVRVSVGPTPSLLVVVTNDGHRVEGASVENAVAILRGLR